MFKIAMEEIRLKADSPDFVIKCMRPSHSDYIETLAQYEDLNKKFGLFGPQVEGKEDKGISADELRLLSDYNRFIFKSFVKEISGLEIAGRVIDNATEFLECAPHDLASEAIQAVMDKFKVSEADKKKS